MGKTKLESYSKASRISFLIFLALPLLIFIFALQQKQNLSSNAEDSPCGSSEYDIAILIDNPVAYWQLGDSTTTINDCSAGKTHIGSYTGNPINSFLPNGDIAKTFDGRTQYAQIQDADDLSLPTSGILTIEAWIRPDVLEFPHQESSGYVHWLGKGDIGQQEYAARMYSLSNTEGSPNRISGYAFNLAGGLGTGSYFQDTITAGQWIHYALIINTSNTSPEFPTGYTKIYKNGTLRNQDSLSDYSIVPGNSTTPFRIATLDLASFFQGDIGKVAVYNYEIPEGRLLNHYEIMVNPIPSTTPIQ